MEVCRSFLLGNDDLMRMKVIFWGSVFTSLSIPMAKNSNNWIRILIGRKIFIEKIDLWSVWMVKVNWIVANKGIWMKFVCLRRFNWGRGFCPRRKHSFPIDRWTYRRNEFHLTWRSNFLLCKKKQKGASNEKCRWKEFMWVLSRIGHCVTQEDYWSKSIRRMKSDRRTLSAHFVFHHFPSDSSTVIEFLSSWSTSTMIYHLLFKSSLKYIKKKETNSICPTPFFPSHPLLILFSHFQTKFFPEKARGGYKTNVFFS